jgi:putative redox protein
MDMILSFPGGKKVEATYHGFQILTDQPVVDGGTGSAPAPFDLFLTSIVTCTGYYVLSFCQKNEIPTEDIRLHAQFQWNAEAHLVDEIRIEVHVPKDFPEKYRNAVIKAAAVCSVKRNLQHPPKIDIILASD